MSRTERLLDLMQLLRRYRVPVSGSALAKQLGISLRTLYRDVATLQSQGVHIDGAQGLGYVLRPGTLLPPLTFTSEEIDALTLGSRWVAARGDAHLRAAAINLLAKVASVIPAALRHELDSSGLLIGPEASGPRGNEGEVTATADDAVLATVRQAIRSEHKLVIRYRDAAGRETARTIWPFALGYFDRVQVVVAWCETRRADRHFRADRIVAIESAGGRFPRRRQALLKEWREREGIAAPPP